ncbi:MAG TPA: hypothetical protein VIL93_07905, partial [Solirubrobacterales bacterium]
MREAIARGSTAPQLPLCLTDADHVVAALQQVFDLDLEVLPCPSNLAAERAPLRPSPVRLR